MSAHGPLEKPDVKLGNPDDEYAPVLKCVCGVSYPMWEQIISIYAADADPMPCCGRRFYFRQTVTVFEVPNE